MIPNFTKQYLYNYIGHLYKVKNISQWSDVSVSDRKNIAAILLNNLSYRQEKMLLHKLNFIVELNYYLNKEISLKSMCKNIENELMSFCAEEFEEVLDQIGLQENDKWEQFQVPAFLRKNVDIDIADDPRYNQAKEINGGNSAKI